ncbi:hypothetical protein GALMADRAFT_141887 [Galerina marginata CBS 339.88]|uniref:Uncharacterized protein n=1 Tax=Galerina marginata (strain CBS 339.88) TaxID=685588 RepID=A0A067SVR8_GALM3|nr:hypothetical protein GALMADRAFT_141887 [Galerina marginata CBS 339.88]
MPELEADLEEGTSKAAGDTDRPSTSQLLAYYGDEDNYALSPMANLWIEYATESESSRSTSQKVSMLCTTPTLARDQILDLGPTPSSIVKRYSLKGSILVELTQTIKELQIFIERMASLIPERNSFFIVDPGETTMSILRGSHTVAQIHAAWTALVKRLESAQRFMLKYQDEYKQGLLLPLLLPISTAPSIWKNLHEEGGNDSDNRLRYMYEQVPHLRNLLKPENLTCMKEGADWSHVLPLPSWLHFPKGSSDIVEEVPKTSYKMGDEFTLPPVYDKGKGRESEPPDEKNHEKRVSIQPPEEKTSGLLSSDTPFRKNNDSFFGISDQPTILATQGSNILYGLVTNEPSAFANMQSPTKVGKTTPKEDLPEWRQRQEGGLFSTPKLFANWGSLRQSAVPPANRNVDGWGTGIGSTSRGTLLEQNISNPTTARPSQIPRPSSGQSPLRNPIPPIKPSQNPGPPVPSSPSTSNGEHGRKGGGGGGGGGSGRGGSGGWSPHGSPRGSYHSALPEDTPRIAPAYGNPFVPTIKAELKQEQLPSWDGNHDTAVEYFWEVQQNAQLGGHIPSAMGLWLWKNLKKGLQVLT